MLRGNWPVIDRDRAAFLGVFLIGLVTILLGSGRADASGGLPWTVLVLLIVFMVAYAWLAHHWNVRYWGDMCYYMGFLFTLVSMMAALSQYTAGTSLDEIIPTFALALGTTVTGLVLRVVGDEPPDEQHVELPFLEPAIRGGAKRVGKALDGLANEVERVQRDLRGGGPDLLASLRTGLVEPVTSQAERLARALDDMSHRADSAGAVLGNVSGDIKTRWKETWAQLETPAERLVAFGRDVSALTDDLRGLADAQASVLKDLESVRETSAGVLDQSRIVLAIQGQALNEFRSVVASVLDATTRAHDGLVTTTDQIGARTFELQRTLGSWQSAVDAMTRVGEAQVALVEDVHNSVAELGRSVAGLQPAVRALANGAAGMHEAGTQVGAASDRMERLSDEMAKFPQRAYEAHKEGAALLGREMDRSLDKVTTSLRQAIRDAVVQAGSGLDGQSRRGSLLGWLFRRRAK